MWGLRCSLLFPTGESFLCFHLISAAYIFLQHLMFHWVTDRGGIKSSAGPAYYRLREFIDHGQHNISSRDSGGGRRGKCDQSDAPEKKPFLIEFRGIHYCYGKHVANEWKQVITSQLFFKCIPVYLNILNGAEINENKISNQLFDSCVLYCVLD